MQARLELIDRVRVGLARAGFAVSERYEIRPISFDVVARRDNDLLLIKVLGNVDAFSERVAEEMRTLARILHGTPLLVGERTGSGPLEDGVAYRHRGIPAMTAKTLEDHFLEHVAPMAYATPGGLNVELNGTLLRELREKRAISLGVLAQAAGVSRRAIQMYEEGMRATIDAALRLEEYLEASLISPIDPLRLFQPVLTEPEAGEPAAPGAATSAEEEVYKMLRSAGFQVTPTKQSPFNALTHQHKDAILTGVDRAQDATMARRAELMTSISRITERDGMIVVRRQVRYTQLHGTPVVQREELERVQDAQDLTDLLRERKKDKEA